MNSSKKVYKNCYYCIKSPFVLFNRFFGPGIFKINCFHDGSNEVLKIHKSILYVIIALIIAILSLTFSLYTTYEAIVSHQSAFQFYAGVTIRSSLGFITFFHSIIWILGTKYRMIQLLSLSDLLQNGKYYGVQTLISLKTTTKLRKDSLWLVWRFSIFLFGMVFMFNNNLQKISINNTMLTFIFIAGSCTYLTNGCNTRIDCLIYREILGNCYKKIKIILENHLNYIEIENQIHFFNKYNVKYVTLEEQLKKLRKLHIAVYDNIVLYYKLLSNIAFFQFGGFMLWSILTNYAIVDIFRHPIIWKVNKKYCFLIFVTNYSVLNMVMLLKDIENLRKVVSFKRDAFCEIMHGYFH